MVQFRCVSAVAFSLLALLLTTDGFAQSRSSTAPSAGPIAFWPGAVYDPAIPTLKTVIGHENGERITRPEDAQTYLKALAAAAPNRIKLVEYGRSWEGRPLVYAIVASSENIAALDKVRAGIGALRSPRDTSDAKAEDLITSLPSTVFIAYGVHGNEISPTDAGLLTAYHLLAAQGDETVDKILKNTIVFLDPIQNPDGRARFVHNYETTEGLTPSPSRIAAERNEPWPGGRTNHYLFDLNRDWFALTQPETEARIKVLREWSPLVFVDAHEMGTDSTYYFAPEAVPYNPNLAAEQRNSLQLFGRNNAKWFDKNGFEYFTREVYDAFFPGYGASWPSYYGAVAMTYEQSSARGLRAERTNGTKYTYRDTVRQHFVASVSTAEATADYREKLLRDFWTYQTSAIQEGKSQDIKNYIFPASDDNASAYRLAGLLARQGIEVRTATEGFVACSKGYEKGAHVITLAQPSKRLIRTLLDAQIPLDPAFVAEQERLREKDLPDAIYDVTAWSLPLMYNVEMDACSETIDADSGFASHDGGHYAPSAIDGPADAIAFLAPWGERPAINLLARAHNDGLVVTSSDKAFTIGGRRYPSGTLIFRPQENSDYDVRDLLSTYAEETGAEVVGVASTWVDEGPNFGSRNVVRMPSPRIAIAWDAPTSAYMAGATRFVLERQFGAATTPVRAYDLTDRGLDQFDVLILPGEASFYGGGYESFLGANGAKRLKAWVERGGTLIATGRAVRWLADPKQKILSIRREQAVREDTEKAENAKKRRKKAIVPGEILTTPDDARAAVTPESETPDPVAGVLARARVDPDHWMAAGVKPTVISLLAGGDIYTPLALDEGVNIARFEGPETLIASGYIWEDTKAQVAYKPLVVAERHGAGVVIAFTQDPTFRAQMDGMNTLLANAVFRGPAHTGKLRGR